MNKSYLIAPLVCILVFVAFYRSASQRMEAEAALKEQAVAAAKAAEETKRVELDRKAEADARIRQEERDRLEREREAKRKADYEDALARLRDETAGYAAEAAKFSTEAAALEQGLLAARQGRETLGREVFDLTREVELPRIARRTAELEIQRAHQAVVARFSESALAALPAAPPPAPR
jgi:hypothetical protein